MAAPRHNSTFNAENQDFALYYPCNNTECVDKTILFSTFPNLKTLNFSAQTKHVTKTEILLSN